MINKKLSTKSFIISQVLIFLGALGFIFFIYYILNLQYPSLKNYSFSSGPITSAPASISLDLSDPQDSVLTFKSSALVSGNTAPDSLVLVTTDTQDIMLTSDSKGNFSTDLSLDEGVNNIQVAVFDKNGEERLQKRVVYYSKEKI